MKSKKNPAKNNNKTLNLMQVTNKEKLFVYTLVIIVTLLFGALPVFSETGCDLEPICVDDRLECGCDGLKTRHTLCEGGCSEWSECSKPETELNCLDNSDDDCDGDIDCLDADCSEYEYCIDSDGDGSPLSEDCDDTNPNVNPSTLELCNNLDDDCDGVKDEGLSRTCGITNQGECRTGIEECVYGTWEGCTAVTPIQETCNSKDDDCDGDVDEGCECSEGDVRECGQDVGECQKGTQSCISGEWGSCVGGIKPRTDSCGNSKDDDCDGDVDEGCEEVQQSSEQKNPEQEQSKLIEAKNDISKPGFAAKRPPMPSDANVNCIDKDGDGFGTGCAKGIDCDDLATAINPAATEVCNAKDDDCDGRTDEGLNRVCGETDVGICSLGQETCDDGVWTECDAILPLEEICDNKKDDDCDGRTDENCNNNIDEDERALKQILDIKFLGDYDYDSYLEMHRITKRYVTIETSAKSENGNTKIKIKIQPIKEFKEFTLFGYIPKSIASSASDITFSVTPEIIQDDPLVAWHFATMAETQELEYEVKGEFEDAAELTRTIAIAEDAISKTNPWYINFMPIFFVPLIGLIFIVLLQAVEKKVDKNK